MTKGMWLMWVVSIMVYMRNSKLPEDQNLKKMLEKPAWQGAKITQYLKVYIQGELLAVSGIKGFQANKPAIPGSNQQPI